MTVPTAAPLALPAEAAPKSSPPLAAVVVLALLVVALLARTAFLLWEPAFDGAIHYDDIAPLGTAYWTMHIAVGGPAFAVSWVGAAILAAALARGRSAPVTLVGALLVGVGGIVFALVVTAESLPFAYAADLSVLPEAEGRALFDALNAHLGMLIPAILGSQAAIATGVLLILVAALVTRAMPRWLAIAGLAYLVVFAAVPFEALPRGATIASDLVQSALVVGIGWSGLRAARRRA